MSLAAASTSALRSTYTGTLPGPTPSAGLPGAVGRAHHRGAAGGEDQRGGVVVHQLLRPGQAHLLHARDQALGHAGTLAGLDHQPDRFVGAGLARGVRRDDAAVACLDRDQHLVDRGGVRVRGRAEPHDHPDRPADLDDPALGVAAQHADRRDVADGLPDGAGRELDLDPLVLGDAVPGLVAAPAARADRRRGTPRRPSPHRSGRPPPGRRWRTPAGRCGRRPPAGAPPAPTSGRCRTPRSSHTSLGAAATSRTASRKAAQAATTALCGPTR